MIDNSIFGPASGARGVPADGGGPRNRREAASAFEKQLLEQFVGTMMEGVFSESFGEASPLAGAGRDEQKQLWVSQLAGYLSERGGLGLADKLLAQWQERFGPEKETVADDSAANPIRTP
jgi:Rod binding domain-containing protein